MDLLLIGQLLWLRGHIRRRERWSPAELEQQVRGLFELLTYAQACSPFCARLYKPSRLDRWPSCLS
jgi:hypothetical protein